MNDSRCRGPVHGARSRSGLNPNAGHRQDRPCYQGAVIDHGVVIDAGQRYPRRRGQTFACPPPAGLRVADSLGDQLRPRGHAKLGVHVCQVSLHGSRRDEQARGDVGIAQALAYQSNDVLFGRR